MKKLFTLFALFIMAIAVNAYDVVVDNMCFTLNKQDMTATLVQDESYTYKYIGDVVIPEKITVEGAEYTVTGIGMYAFFYSNDLLSVKIPETVEVIETYAFSWCKALKEIVIPSKVKILNTYLFSDCSALEKITLPEGVEEITEGVFYNCTSLKSLTLPSTLKVIEGPWIFNGCTSLTEIHAKMATPMPIAQEIFDYDTYDNCTLYVPAGKSSVYMETMYWDLFVNIMEEDAEPVGIEGVVADEAENNVMYDLQGRRIYAPVKGIYIQNGKKIIKK